MVLQRDQREEQETERQKANEKVERGRVESEGESKQDRGHEKRRTVIRKAAAAGGDGEDGYEDDS